MQYILGLVFVALVGSVLLRTAGHCQLVCAGMKVPGGRLSGGHFESVTVPEPESIGSGVTV